MTNFRKTVETGVHPRLPINILRKLTPAPVNKQLLQTLIQLGTDEYLL